MKKLLFVVLLCFDFIAFDQAKLFHHEQDVENFQSMHVQSGYFSEEISFNKIANGYNNRSFYKKLSQLAAESGVNLFVYPSVDDAVVYSYFTDEILLQKLAVSKATSQSFNKSNQRQISTKYPGKLYPLSMIGSISFDSLLIVTEKAGTEGIDNFCLLMDAAFPDYREDYEYIRFTEKTVYGNIRDGNQQQMKEDCVSAFLFMGILILLTLCTMVLNKVKSYGVKKLHGYSCFKLYTDDLIGVVLLSFLSFLIIGELHFIIQSFSISLWLWFFTFHSFMILMIAVILLCNHVFLSIQNINSLLNNKISLGLYMSVNMIIKVVMTAVLMMVFYETAQSLVLQLPYIMQRDQFLNKYKDYISFEHNDDAYDSETLNRIYMLLKEPYKVYYWERSVINTKDVEIPILKTNEMFLESQHIRDTHHKKLELPQTEQDVLVGIADNYTEITKKYLSREDLCVNGSYLDLNQNTVTIHCHYAHLKNSQMLDIFFPDAKSSNMRIKTPVITTRIDSINSDTIFIDTSLPGNKKSAILETLKRADIPASNYKIVNYEDVYDRITDSSPDIFMFHVKRILIVGVLLAFIIIQLIMMYIKMYRKKIFVSYLLGISNFQIFRKFLLIEIIGSAISAVLFMQLIKWQRGAYYQIDNIYWWIVLFYMLSESICLLITLKQMKYKDIHKQLKGAD